jgi:hypothetical protein
MPITQAMYEEREAFLLDLVEVGRSIREVRPELSCPRFGFGAGNQEPEGTDGDLCRIRRDAEQLYGALDGGEVQPGSLYPPTAEHLGRKAALEARLARVLESM